MHLHRESFTRQSLTLSIAAFLLLPTLSFAAPITFSAAGANAAAIQGTVDAFRAALGTWNPNVMGSFGLGRREACMNVR